MTTRITCLDEAAADSLAAGIDDTGFDVAVIAEQDAESEATYVVYTPATPEQLTELLPADAAVETY